jgi:hypothetical protein
MFLNTLFQIFKYIFVPVQKLFNKGQSPSNGYTMFGNKSYSYIDSQISVHRKHEIIEQSGI